MVPTLVQALHGVDFLRFTEQPGTIWSTTSLPESLRLMGYWISYLGVGYGGRLRPLFGDGAVFLFAWPVVLAGLLVPAVVLSSFALLRRSRAAAFLLVLALAGLVVMVAGFPEGTPLRRAMNFTYNHVAPLQFLRTTYKAGPLLALALAGLGGLGAARAAPWLRARGRALPVLAAVALAGLAAVSCWPLVRGRALDSRLTWERIPAAWEDAADHVDATVGADGRAVVLPGQLYADYDWGGTVDAVLPALADGRWRSATRCRTPTCARSTCSGRSTGSCSSGARCRASSPRCWICCRRAPWSPEPTTTVPAAAPRPRPTPPTCSTSSARPTSAGARCAASRARRARSAPRARCRACAPGTGRERGRWCAWRPTRARRSSTAARTRSRGWPRSARCPAAGSPTPAMRPPPTCAGPARS